MQAIDNDILIDMIVHNLRIIPNIVPVYHFGIAIDFDLVEHIIIVITFDDGLYDIEYN